MGERIHPKSKKKFSWGKRKTRGLTFTFDPGNPRNKIYIIDYYLPDGTRKRERIGPNKRDALDVLAKRRTQIREDKWFELERESKIYFRELSEKFLKEYSRPPKKAVSSVGRDRLSVKHLNKFFGNKLAHQITREAIEAYQNKRLDDGVVGGTVNREVACLKTIFNKAVDWKLVKFSPARKIKMLKEPPPIVRYLSEQELPKLLKACEISEAKGLYPIVFVGLNTGMRLGEILNLKWRDIDFINGFIHVEKAKGEKRRDIPLTTELTKVLKFGIKVENTEYVFCDENGKPFRNINRSWKTAKRRAGIKNFRFHDLRHTFASYLVMGGVDLYMVSELLGHSSVEVTKRYAHLSPKYKKRAMEVLSKIVTAMDTSMDTSRVSSEKPNAPVAQLDRASDFESAGRAFESHRACQIRQGSFEYILKHPDKKSGCGLVGATLVARSLGH